MKTKILLHVIFFSLFPLFLKGQLIVNGSVETSGVPSLAGWQEYESCDPMTSVMDAPAGAGNWCVEKLTGNVKGCFPSYVYQTFPAVANGNNIIITGWVKKYWAGLSGIYLGVKNSAGAISLLNGDTTTSATWHYIMVSGTYSLSAGDTAAVILNAGMTGGPVGGGYARFDSIEAQIITGINPPAYSLENTIHIYHDAENHLLNVYFTGSYNGNVYFSMYDISARRVKIFELHQGTNEFNIEKLPAGFYFYNAATDKKIISTGKIFQK